MALKILEALRNNQIIPDVLDNFNPIYSLSINYPRSNIDVGLGNTIPTDKAQDPPAYDFHPIVTGDVPKPEQAFVLVLTDPDAKSRGNPIWSEFCHWIVANVPAPEASGASSSKETGQVLENYMPPTPPQGTGDHRYVFVLLRGDADKIHKLKAPKERKQWGYGKERHGVRQWAAEYGLEVVSANFFFAHNE